MAVIVGLIMVLGAVLLGFNMAGGHVGALIHLSEFVTIGGASFGALIIMSPKKVLMDLVRGFAQVVKGSPYNKATYAELFELLYSLTRLVRREGALALDAHVNNPKDSALFQKYPRIHRDHHVVEFLCTGLSAVVDGKADGAELTAALEEEIGVVEREHHAAIS